MKLQIPRKGNSGSTGWTGFGAAWCQYNGFCKEFNERTAKENGLIIPVVITIYADRSFSFVTKTPPAAVLIKRECKIEAGSGQPNKVEVAKISREALRKIAEQKMEDLNASDIESAERIIAGTARSMGVAVED